MSGFVIGGKVEAGPPGIDVKSWRDDPVMRVLVEDSRQRDTRWVRSLILHATEGDEPQIVRTGAGPAGLAKRVVKSWLSDGRHAGAHLIIDCDGTVWQLADLLTEATFHAQTLNEVSIGIELAQTDRLEIWERQLDVLAQIQAAGILDWLTLRFSIQRQYHHPYLGDSRSVPRLAAGGQDCVGVFGHRDQTTRRGRGDPGDAAFARIEACRYEGFDHVVEADKDAWRPRQSAAGTTVDGVPGPLTAQALLRTIGRPMWVARPGDGP